MKKCLPHIFSNQHGSVINVALLILILIFLIGIGLSKMSTTDVKIASNIKQDMTTFYDNDASLETAGELIEQNLACITGFRDTADKDKKGVALPANEQIIGGMIYVQTLNFAHNVRKKSAFPGADPAVLVTVDGVDVPLVDFYFPPNFGDVTAPHTTVTLGGASRFSKGSAIQMAAGYEGLGKGAAAGGASIIYDVFSQRIGPNNTTALHYMQWVHLIKPSAGCFF